MCGLQPESRIGFFLVQEFIDGKNLEEELAERGKFSQAEVLQVLGNQSAEVCT